MSNLSSSLMNFRLLTPEMIWLEPEQVEQAKTMSERLNTQLGEHALSEVQRWQIYLNALAVVSFEQWLSERLPEPETERSPQWIDSVCTLEIKGFKFCLITVEHVLDETVPIPQAVIEQPEFAAHFYVVQEVSEEQEWVMMRGFCRYDEFIRYRNNYPIQAGYYQFPLTCLDTEPNHLLFYCRALQPDAIFQRQSITNALPTDATLPTTETVLVALSNTTTNLTTKLTQWLQDTFDQNWQMIDQLINPEAYFALATRTMELGKKRGKLINLGVQLGQQAVALLVNVTSEAEDKLGVLIQLHPTGEARYLIPDLKLRMRSHSGKVLQEVISRNQDNYIQLKPIKGRPGIRFSIAIHWGDEMVEEKFEL